MNLKNIRKVYFIGIGGIGMSAIARMLLGVPPSPGFGVAREVIGSDRAKSLVTEELEKLGAKIFYEQKAENITADIDLVIYTIAIPDDQSELVKARKLGIECKTYPEMLGIISADKYTIAVAGTHGKTTTTAMIAEIMIEAGLDPTVIVGSLLRIPEALPLKASQGEASGTNFIAGKSEYLVVEACEYRRSFLNLHPTLVVVTNIDADHLDYYKDLDDIKNAFDQFLSQSKNKIIDTDYKKYLDQVPELLVPGEHNRLNAAAALAVADFLKIDLAVAINSLKKFTGTWRRFEFKGETKSGLPAGRQGALVYDDYAHHPTEIRSAIQGARDFMVKKGMTGKLIIAFQPHLYSRTKLLKNDFAQALALADEVILLPIYAAREPDDPEISSELLAGLIRGKGGSVDTAGNLSEASKIILNQAKRGDLVITMGAGDISQLASNLLE